MVFVSMNSCFVFLSIACLNLYIFIWTKKKKKEYLCLFIDFHADKKIKKNKIIIQKL